MRHCSLTSGYSYDDAQTVADRFAGDAEGMTYSRLQNPTVAMLEERIALLEGAEACRAQASGMAAMTAALLCQLSAGDHCVAAKAAFGSCRWLVDHLLPRFGIETTVIDSADDAQWERAIRPNTKVFFFETPANPTLDVVNLKYVCDVAKAHGITTVVDKRLCHKRAAETDGFRGGCSCLFRDEIDGRAGGACSLGRFAVAKNGSTKF